MHLNLDQTLRQLPKEYADDLLPVIRRQFEELAKTIVVFDDDPTGTQTCYDVTVLTSWSVALIADELKRKPSVLFILTNSRSLPEGEAVKLIHEIGKNLREAVAQSGREILVISRSDSTLRGHFPAEVDAIAAGLGITGAIRIIIPAFIEGGRFTIDDVHYLAEDGKLVPVSDTPFAKDAAFGYRHANLKEWVEEKTKGSVRAEVVHSLSLVEIRAGGPQAVADKLKSCKPGGVCIVNAVSYRDLEVVAMGAMLAESSGQKLLYRSSATIVPIRAGMASGRIFKPNKSETGSPHGILVIVGSYVPKTTVQLSWLLATGGFKSVEINVTAILNADHPQVLVEEIAQRTDHWIAAGKNVVIYTSRKLEMGRDPESSLKINAIVSGFLVSITQKLFIRPKFIVAKGGITSSDLASKGLASKSALIMGQVIPGVPVWRLDEKSKFPQLIYVVFPGNVGDDAALANVCERLREVRG